MNRVVVQGCQWGDEGKGKITDYFSEKAKIVVRFQGGNNAGHTIVFGGKKYALRLIPSGVFHKGTTCVLASGMVINPEAFLEEIEALKEAGYSADKILVSDRASVLLDYHKMLDGANEKAKSKGKIGTTGRGIGPCYTDKASRIGLRMGDLIDKDTFKTKLKATLEFKNRELESYGLEPLKFNEVYKKYQKLGEQMKPFITDTATYLQKEVKKNTKILFEGAQGAMLCLTYGTYPYVTSSCPMANSIPLSCGIPCNSVEYVIGIAKAYTTRVGEGPFPTELFGSLADEIRERGHEYGTVTKRPRRIGYLDTCVLRHAASISGVNGWAITLLDVLTGLDELKICDKYIYGGKEVSTIPATLEEYKNYEPHYITLKGWKEDISKVKSFDELPKNAQKYIRTIEKLTGVNAIAFSVGPDRNQTIVLYDPFKD